MDYEVFKEDINLLKKHQLKDIKLNGNKMTGTIKVDKSSTLFTSIPYEKGWKVYVDGKRTNYQKIADGFIGIDLSKGTHQIKMVYYPHHLFLGIMGSIISIIILVVYQKVMCKENVKEKKIEKNLVKLTRMCYNDSVRK